MDAVRVTRDAIQRHGTSVGVVVGGAGAEAAALAARRQLVHAAEDKLRRLAVVAHEYQQRVRVARCAHVPNVTGCRC